MFSFVYLDNYRLLVFVNTIPCEAYYSYHFNIHLFFEFLIPHFRNKSKKCVKGPGIIVVS
jgi:hypothetical protein